MSTLSVYYTPPALADLRRVHRFLAERNKSAADRAVATIHRAVRALSAFPESGRRTPDGDLAHRELLVRFGNSGYVVLYGIEASDIVVVAVRHQREAGY